MRRFLPYLTLCHQPNSFDGSGIVICRVRHLWRPPATDDAPVVVQTGLYRPICAYPVGARPVSPAIRLLRAHCGVGQDTWSHDRNRIGGVRERPGGVMGGVRLERAVPTPPRHRSAMRPRLRRPSYVAALCHIPCGDGLISRRQMMGLYVSISRGTMPGVRLV